VRRDCLAAGVLERLAHPHALRSYWATHLLEAGVAVHVVSARLGHADLRTTSRYAADRPEAVAEVADILDRRQSPLRSSPPPRTTRSARARPCAPAKSTRRPRAPAPPDPHR